MIGRRKGFSTMGLVVAWTAAYALVFQIMLMSALGASLVGGTALATPLCVGSQVTAGDTGGEPQKAAAHCPLCLSRVDAAVLPPPVPTPEIDRVAIEVHYRVIVRDGLRTAQQRRPHQPRAPPAFA